MAKRRRGWGEGSIYRRDDGLYQVRVRVDGKRLAFYAASEDEAKRLLRLKVGERERGALVVTANHTVAQYLETWLAEVVTPSVRPSTLARYRQIVTLHLIPAIGRHRLGKLSPQHLSACYRQLSATLSASTVRNAHGVIHSALDTALQWELVARNVADLVDPPLVKRDEMRFLTADEARRLLDTARGDPLEALYVLALTTGMRQGELLGLKWADLDLKAGLLNVRRSLSRVKGQGFVEQAPKTAKGSRTIALTPIGIDALKHHHTQQLQARLFAGPAWVASDLVFCTSHGTPIEAQNLRVRSFAPLLKAAGLPSIRFHDLRHSAASLLLALGVHPKIAAEILGHANVSITLNTYSHVAPTLQADAMRRLGELLG